MLEVERVTRTIILVFCFLFLMCFQIMAEENILVDVGFGSKMSNSKKTEQLAKDIDIKKRVKLLSYKEFKATGKSSHFDKKSQFISDLEYDDRVIIALIEGDLTFAGDLYLDDFFLDIQQAFSKELNVKSDFIYQIWIEGNLTIKGTLYNKEPMHYCDALVVEKNGNIRNIIAGGTNLFFLKDLNISEIYYHAEGAEGWLTVNGTKNIKIEADINQFWKIHGDRWEFGLTKIEMEHIFIKEFDFLYHDEKNENYYLDNDLFVKTLLKGTQIFNNSEFLKDKFPDEFKKWKSNISEDTDYDGVFVDLENERLDNIPDIIVQIPKITSLNLTDNKFKIFPNDISQMKNLKYLDVSENPITSLTGDGSELNLEVFLFYDSPQVSLKEAVRFAKTMPRLKAFGFSSKHDHTLEESIKELEALKNGVDGLMIDAMNNFVASILPWKKPANNPKLDNYYDSLRYKTEDHPLVDFPEELTKIEELYLHDLKFKTLRLKKPLPNLNTLSLCGSIYKLPESPRWEDFPALKEVDLSLGKWLVGRSEVKILKSLRHLPKTVIKLSLDHWMSVDSDIIIEIQKIPKQIAHLENLEYLTFYKSQIDVGLLLELLPKLSKLKELDLGEIELSFFQEKKLLKILPKGCKLSGGDD